MSVDYRALLEKYIAHVARCNGMHFVPANGSGPFTAEEVEALRELAPSVFRKEAKT